MGFCHQVLVRELHAAPAARQPRQKVWMLRPHVKSHLAQDGVLNIIGFLSGILTKVRW